MIRAVQLCTGVMTGQRGSKMIPKDGYESYISSVLTDRCHIKGTRDCTDAYNNSTRGDRRKHATLHLTLTLWTEGAAAAHRNRRQHACTVAAETVSVWRPMMIYRVRQKFWHLYVWVCCVVPDWVAVTRLLQECPMTSPHHAQPDGIGSLRPIRNR